MCFKVYSVRISGWLSIFFIYSTINSLIHSYLQEISLLLVNDCFVGLVFIMSIFYLSLQPPNTPKRVQDDEAEEDDYENEFERQRKIRKLAKSRAIEAELAEKSQKIYHKEPSDSLQIDKPITNEERERILKLVENEDVEVSIIYNHYFH